MGGHSEFDSIAMEAVAESLETAASDIALTGINWPEQQGDSSAAALDIHAESARVWAESVVERLQVWAKRAHRISEAHQRHQTRRLR